MGKKDVREIRERRMESGEKVTLNKVRKPVEKNE